jgi:hypothetical protein
MNESGVCRCEKGFSTGEGGGKGGIHKPLTKPWRTWITGYLFSLLVPNDSVLDACEV